MPPFTCRTEAQHEEILARLCNSFGVAAKNKAILKIIENYEQVASERERYQILSARLERELESLKNAIRNKLDAEKALAALVEPKKR